MNFSFENQGTHTYLVYTVDEYDDMIDSMSLGMLTNNKIPGLAHTLFTQMDSTKYIKYDVSAKISVKQFFAGQVNKKRLIGVFNGIVSAMLSAEDYMIDVDTIVLDLDYIFADVSTCDTVLICLPIVTDDIIVSKPDLGTFFKNIMFSTRFDQTENCDHVAQIINYLNSAPVFSLEDFKKVLDSISGAAKPAAPQPQVQQTRVQQPVVQRPQPQPVSAPQPQAQQPATQRPQPQVQPKAPVSPAPQPKMNVPSAPQPASPVANQAGAPEKKISMFNLLMHYSKENADLYKAQKAAKKSGQPQTPAAPKNSGAFTVPGAPGAAPASQPKSATPQGGFEIPGQAAPANQGFAIPGQVAPAPAAPRPQVASQSQMQPKAPQPAAPQSAPAPAPAYTPAPMPQGQSMNFGETTVLGGGGGVGETTVLGATAAIQPRPHLVRAKNSEKINLSKPVFRIGKEKSYVDYFIGDNSAISRSHANIISRDGEFFVVDTNSTNHTYVNGQMIQSNVETKIDHGAKIKLANEDFEFRLY